jgi:hypothetical protein
VKLNPKNSNSVNHTTNSESRTTVAIAMMRLMPTQMDVILFLLSLPGEWCILYMVWSDVNYLNSKKGGKQFTFVLGLVEMLLGFLLILWQKFCIIDSLDSSNKNILSCWSTTTICLLVYLIVENYSSYVYMNKMK